MDNNHVPVLIVGAGPTGLMAAILLSQLNIPFRIIDNRASRTRTSNALGIQTRTLELLDDLNLIDRFLKHGQKVSGIAVDDGKKTIADLSTDDIDSPYPFLLIVPQNVTETLLDERLEELGHKVERPVKFLELDDMDKQIKLNLENADGQQETLHCDWLLACDGAHSSIRKELSVPFEGSNLPQQFLLADVQADSPFRNDRIDAIFSDQGILALFPINNHTLRLVADVSKSEQQDKNQPVSLLELQKLATERTNGRLQIKESSWSSRFWIHSKMVPTMRYASVFLLGDAAHIHSPAGGQGMNTGLQDAYNLVWKLAMVIKKQANTSLLESYHLERHPIAAGVLRDTSRMTHMALAKNPIIKWLRRGLFQIIANNNWLRRQFMTHMTQIGLHYTSSTMIDYDYKISRQAIQPGERAPDAIFSDENGKHRRLYDYLRGYYHHLLLFTGEMCSKTELAALQNYAAHVANSHRNMIQPIIITNPFKREQLEIQNLPKLIDNNLGIHKKYAAKEACVYLIRPDNYVAFCSSKLNLSGLADYLGRFLATDA